MAKDIKHTTIKEVALKYNVNHDFIMSLIKRKRIHSIKKDGTIYISKQQPDGEFLTDIIRKERFTFLA